MSKSNRFKRPRGWKAIRHPEFKEQVATRQGIRAKAFGATWKVSSGENALRNDKGIIPRKIRRDMARSYAKRKLLP